MFAPSSSCPSRPWLDSSPESTIMEVHMAIVFMTWYSYAKSWVLSTSYIMPYLPVRAVPVRDLILPPGLMLWKCTRSLCLWPDLHRQSTQCGHLPVRAFPVHDLIFPPGLILWKYIRSLCLWLDSPMLKDWVLTASYTMFASSSSCP